MKFERIWTALLAAALLAVPVTLCLAAVLSVLAPGFIFGRNTLTPTYLIAWAVGTGVCLFPQRVLGQWLTALWLAVAALLIAAAIYLSAPHAMVLSGALGVAATAIAATALVLRGRRASNL